MRRVTQFHKNGFPTFSQQQMTLYSTTLVPATCFGDSNGDAFDDLQAVQGTTAILSDVARAIKSIKVMNSTSTVDGIQITYAPSEHDGAKDIVAHGTTDQCTDVNVKKSVFTIGDDESIVAISGTTQNTPSYGLRVTSLKFSIRNSKTGIKRTAGPFGGVTGTPFNVNVSGEFIALSGFAIDTNKSLAQLGDEAGGLYGLVFDTTNFNLEYDM
ncbi:hypothetical protein C8F01DRAFT_1275044 [Mycena amicta]|nr:hypothetical protein C8F01DRAFT_1275044 [Mycena amicta]